MVTSPDPGYSTSLIAIVALIIRYIILSKVTSPEHSYQSDQPKKESMKVETNEVSLEDVLSKISEQSAEVDEPDSVSKYDTGDMINQIFADRQSEEREKDGDELLLNKSIDVSQKAKQSILNRTRFTSDNFRKYFQEELDEQENRVWWERDELDNYVADFES